jgi:HEAT repeat protein
VIGLFACGSTPPRPVKPEFDLHDPNGARRLAAVAETVRTRDAAQVPALFALLDDEDDAVRLAAADALRDLVGRDPGYRASASRGERLAMAATWKERVGPAPRSQGAGVGGGGYTGEPSHVVPR